MNLRHKQRHTLQTTSFVLLALLLACAAAHASDVKVALFTAHPPQRLTLKPDGSLRVLPCPTCPPSKLSAPLELTATAGAIAWRFGASSGTSPELSLTGSYQLTPEAGPAVALPFPLRIRPLRGRLQLVITLPREEYVAAVLAGEASSFTSDEALRAMAVAARTYAASFAARHTTEGFDFCDTTHCQDFHWTAISPRIRAAVEATEGELLWYRGALARTYFHRHCGGQLASAAELWHEPAASAPYLAEKPDPYCLRREPASWEAKLTREQISQALASEGFRAPANWQRINITQRTASGRSATLSLEGAGPPLRLPAPALRLAVGRTLGWNLLRSDLYTVASDGPQILFTGHGYGHGVGLCQTGAEQMGREGRIYREILAFYYPRTRLGLNAQGIAWASFHASRTDVFATAEPPAAFADALRNAIAQAESLTGWQLPEDAARRPQLWLYPSLAMFRDSTGEPGWVMAATRGRRIRLQPWQRLQEHGGAMPILRHELLHQLVEAHAAPSTPLWFREGLVLWLEPQSQSSAPPARPLSTAALEQSIAAPPSEAAMRAAYAEARTRVDRMVRASGKPAVLDWLARGLPASLR